MGKILKFWHIREVLVVLVDLAMKIKILVTIAGTICDSRNL